MVRSAGRERDWRFDSPGLRQAPRIGVACSLLVQHRRAPSRTRGREGGGLVLERSFLTTVIEHTKTPPLGLSGGSNGRPSTARLIDSGGTSVQISKATRLDLAAGDRLELSSGGGGGFGDPAERDPGLVERDLREGYITDVHARRWYPHAL